MKRIYIMTAIMAIGLASCMKEDETITVPEVVTVDVADVKTTSATVIGEIRQQFNRTTGQFHTVAMAGIVYSSVEEEPALTIAHGAESTDSNTYYARAQKTDKYGQFVVELTGLEPDNTYYVRAYANNEFGTGYGEVLEFTTGNAAPAASDVRIDGDPEIGDELTGSYTYSDAEEDAESGSTFQWYMADSRFGEGETKIEGATGPTYTVREADSGKYIGFGVTPGAATGTKEGTEVRSEFIGPVIHKTYVTFTYNGEEVTYRVKTSPVTGRRWLDRNLGASEAPSAVDDWANYGDLFQWGRGADGHQVVTRTGPRDEHATVTKTVWELSSADVPGHSDFIGNDTSPWNWRALAGTALWQGVDGINNPCPAGWRLPTLAEADAELFTDIHDAFSKLNITYGGQRNNSGGLVSSDVTALYWTSDIGGSTNEAGIRFSFTATSYTKGSRHSAFGGHCRCIED